MPVDNIVATFTVTLKGGRGLTTPTSRSSKSLWTTLPTVGARTKSTFNIGHLSLGQIHAALSYYFDHQEEFDRLIEQSLKRADALAAAAQDSPGRRRLRAQGKL